MTLSLLLIIELIIVRRLENFLRRREVKVHAKKCDFGQKMAPRPQAQKSCFLTVLEVNFYFNLICDGNINSN